MQQALRKRDYLSQEDVSIAFREVLGERFTSGRDTRAAGAIFEIENPVLEQVWPQATWRPAEMTFTRCPHRRPAS